MFVKIVNNFKDDERYFCWYRNFIGEKFEVKDYRHSPYKYYERLDRQWVFEQYPDLNTGSYPEWDFWILKAHTIIVNPYSDELERILTVDD